MPQVEVQHLRYQGDAAKAGRVEFAVADALRTEVADDGRLVLVRSFRLGRIGLAARGASHAMASAWRSILGEARHGGASGAESANCVWFRDRAEARALLMRELARGRTPFAWFWSLAVPDWRSEPLERWLERRLNIAAADTSGEAAAALVVEALVAGCVDTLASIILARIPQPGRNVPVAESGSAEEAPGRATDDARLASCEIHELPESGSPSIALALSRSLPASLRSVLASVSRRPDLSAFAQTLARGLVLQAHPALALSPRRLAAMSALVVRSLQFGASGVSAEPDTPRSRGTMNAAALDEALHRGSAAPGFADDPQIPAPAAASAPAKPIARWQPPEERAASAEPTAVELRSAAAGIFLAIVPLIRLGWREWLADRPELLLHQPGSRLLRHVAAHYRVPADDALWTQLPPVAADDRPPPELGEALRLWRTGLDGWLRRRARLRLADLVLRRGWILPGIETTFVRFPFDAIEIRLRRLALDRDPGWVDWLGHAYRLVYRDRPLIGPWPG